MHRCGVYVQVGHITSEMRAKGPGVRVLVKGDLSFTCNALIFPKEN